MDESSLLSAVEPVAEALAICGADTQQQAQNALMQREDYLTDLNFLEFLLDYWTTKTNEKRWNIIIDNLGGKDRW